MNKASDYTNLQTANPITQFQPDIELWDDKSKVFFNNKFKIQKSKVFLTIIWVSTNNYCTPIWLVITNYNVFEFPAFFQKLVQHFNRWGCRIIGGLSVYRSSALLRYIYTYIYKHFAAQSNKKRFVNFLYIAYIKSI